MASSPPSDFCLGDLVTIDGLVNASQHNGKTGVVLQFQNDASSNLRAKVFAPHARDATLSIKPVNLTKLEVDEAAKVYESLAFWPQPPKTETSSSPLWTSSSHLTIPVSPLDDWPVSDWSGHGVTF